MKAFPFIVAITVCQKHTKKPSKRFNSWQGTKGGNTIQYYDKFILIDL